MMSISRICVFAAAALLTAWPLLTSAEETAAPEKPAATTLQPVKPAAPTVRVTDAANSNEPVVSMTFDETPLSDVIKAFRDATGANIISSGTNLQANISVRLDNVPWRKGLSSILDPQGLQLIEQPAGSGIYVVTTKTVEIPKITRTFELNHAKADDVAMLFKSTLGNTGSATPFPSANVVIVTATEQQLAECEKIIKSIDKQSPQVYIEVRFAELNANASKKLGLKWDSLGSEKGWGVHAGQTTFDFANDSLKERVIGSGRSRKDTASSTDTLADDVRSITESTGSDSSMTRSRTKTDTFTQGRTFTGSLSMDAFSLTMNAFEQTDGVSIFSNPKIIVANEKEAVVDMTTKEPNLTITTTRSGQNSDQLDIAAELEVIPGDKGDREGKGKGLFAGEAFFSYGITLKVTPRISPTGLITLIAEPSISTLESYYEFSGVSSDTPTPRYPIIAMQKMQTVFTMQSGTTAVIGGLTKTTEGNIDSGIPVLRKIPLVGPRVFGWKSREKEQKEIIIFVTVGLADPVTLPENIGMPKNAILGRDLLTGALKEPGDRTKEEVMSLSDPTFPKQLKPKATAAPLETQPKKVTGNPPASKPVTELEAAKAAQPIDVSPLLKNP
ncbi:MAG: secretin N-terminal domain-containing protein [Kiritimatiellae bacterium]|nr:secretin N-terminal domain-containing protein [Kiritimatiellia bacterium]